jgi:hypothetical protein
MELQLAGLRLKQRGQSLFFSPAPDNRGWKPQDGRRVKFGGRLPAQVRYGVIRKQGRQVSKDKSSHSKTSLRSMFFYDEDF